MDAIRFRKMKKAITPVIKLVGILVVVSALAGFPVKAAGVAVQDDLSPPLNLRVNYGHDWVESFYEAGHTVAITVTESDGATVKATAEVVTEPKDFWDGETGFQTSPEDWDPAPPDIQPYDWVYGLVDNVVSAQVQIGEVQGEVYIFTDSITGTIAAPWITDPVPVECLDWGSGEGPFNKDAGLVSTNGADPYACSWDPDSEWDLGAWQDVGVGYFTPDGHWVANAFHAEHWMATWTYDLPPAFWAEGEHSYYYEWAYAVPEPDAKTMDPQAMTVSSSSEGVDTPIYPGYVLIQPWPWMPQQAWTGSSCATVEMVHPDQPTRFVWGWVNDYSMSYEEALAHFNSFTVEAYWDGEAGGSASLAMGELMPFTGQDARFEYVCSLTEPLWRDEFEGDLQEPWFWVNENPDKWSVSDGFLRIYASHQATGGENLLLRSVAEGDFTIETRLLFEPDTNFQFAGLVIYQDVDNLLQFGRAFCDVPDACVGNGIYFDKILGGNFMDGNFATMVENPSEAYLRLEKRGEAVKAFFSYEGITWFEIGTHWIPPDFQVNGVGLVAVGDIDASDADILAEFDYFELTDGWGFLPEGYHDFDQGDVPNWACNAGGWAVDPDDRNTDLWVELAVDGVPLPDWVLAGEYRPDLEENGLCEGGTCGFSTSLWEQISPYETHSVVAYAQDVPSGEWVQLTASPKALTCRTYDIYIFDTDTGETRQLTNLRDAWEFNPRWSPDGKKIVHDRWDLDFGAHGVYITDVKTGVSAPLAGAEGGSYPAWSPSGKWIAFDRGADEDFRVFILPPTGGFPKLVREDAFMASWAPNSKRLAFHHPSDKSIRTMDLNGGGETLVAERGNAPAWSPDGEWIAYEMDGDIWKVRVNINGVPLGDPIQVTSGPGFEGRMTWSNNSKTLAFHAGVGQDTDIWTVPASGGLATWLTGAPGFGDYDANYSFNGRYIAYSSFSPAGQAERLWVAAFTYDLPSGTLSAGTYPYHFELEWSIPEPGSFSGQEGEFFVLNEAPLYEGCVLLRGPMELMGVEYPDGLVCEEIEAINPDQPARFLIGWVPDGEMAFPEAQAAFESMTGRVVWGDGMSAELVRHQTRPFSWNDLDSWFQYVCAFTRELEPAMLSFLGAEEVFLPLLMSLDR